MVSIAVDEQILLRSYEISDAEDLFNTIDRSRAHLHPWLDWVDKTLKPEHSLQFIKQSQHELETQQALALGIFYNEHIIGGIGMHQWDTNTRRAQVGYWIAKEHEGKGIIHKSLVKFLDFLFDKLGLNKVEIQFFPGNSKSAKVAERAGFKVEGIIRQSKLRNGMLEDLVITGIVKSEWKYRSN